MIEDIPPFDISPRAMLEIKHIIKEKNIPAGYSLRVGVKGGHGCAGVDFLIGFDKKGAKDIVYQIDGIDVLMEKGHMLFLSGYHIHYEESGETMGFIFENLRDSAQG